MPSRRLVRPVDREVEGIDVVEIGERDAEAGGVFARAFGGGHADHVERLSRAALGEEVEDEGHGRAGAEAEAHAEFNKGDGGAGRRLLAARGVVRIRRSFPRRRDRRTSGRRRSGAAGRPARPPRPPARGQGSPACRRR